MTRAEQQESSSYALNVTFTDLLVGISSRITQEWLADSEDTFVIKRSEPELRDHHTPREDIYTEVPYSLQLDDLCAELIAPVGEYGPEWSERLIRAAAKLTFAAIEPNGALSMQSDIQMSNRNYDDAVLNYTAEGVLGGDIFDAKKTIVRQGFGAVLAAAGWATMYKQPGYEDNPDALLADLVRDGVVSEISLTIPFGETVKLTSRDIVLKPPVLTRGRHDKLATVKGILSEWNRIKNARPQSTDAEQLDRPGCPVGRKLPGNYRSGVDLAAQLLVDTLSGKKSDYSLQRKSGPNA